MDFQNLSRISPAAVQRRTVPPGMIRVSKLVGVVVALLVGSAVAGCQPHTGSVGSSTKSPTGGNGSAASADPTSAGGSTEWHSVLTVKSDTLYLGQGQLPVPEVDRTTATGAGDLVVRVQCDKGHFDPLFTIDGNGEKASFACTGEVVQQLLVPVKKGSAIAIQPQGDAGTNFALELTITKSASQP